MSTTDNSFQTTPRRDLEAWALEPVRADRGTQYDIDQVTIDMVTGKRGTQMVLKAARFAQKNGEQLLGLKIARHNDEHRPLRQGTEERDAVRDLNKLFSRSNPDLLGPDLAIKIFKDFDQVFFNGMLLMHTSVGWKPSLPGKDCLGRCTEDNFKARIELSAGMCLRRGQAVHPMLLTLQTLLHEMTHALFTCYTGHGGSCDEKCTHTNDECGHGPAFRMVLHGIERRARRYGWMPGVIGKGYGYEERHPLSVHYGHG